MYDNRQASINCYCSLNTDLMYQSALMVVVWGFLSCSVSAPPFSVQANDDLPTISPEQDTLNSAKALSMIEHIERILPTLDYRDADIEGMSAEDGEVRAFYEAGALVKLMATHYGEVGRKSDHYYFEKGRTIAIREITIAYKESIYINSYPIAADSSNIIYLVRADAKYMGSPSPSIAQLPQDSVAQVVDSLMADFARYKVALQID